MSARLIRVSTRATGKRETVRVWIYDTVEELRESGNRFSPDTDFEDTVGLCQTYERIRLVDGEWETIRHPLVVRFIRDRLGSEITTHEMNHAAVELYGRTLPPDTLAAEVLHNANEVLAHLQSDLTARLVNRLYALGYYG